MAVHGVAGYAGGCRCPECVSAQRARERAIAEAERRRWARSPNLPESPAERSRRLAQAERARQRQQQRQAQVAREEQARAEYKQRRQQRRQEAIELQHRAQAQAQAQQAQRQEQYRQALATGDYGWLLADQRRTNQQLRNQISALQRQTRAGVLTELQWRQALETHQLLTKHHTELLRHTQNPDN